MIHWKGVLAIFGTVTTAVGVAMAFELSKPECTITAGITMILIALICALESIEDRE